MTADQPPDAASAKSSAPRRRGLFYFALACVLAWVGLLAMLTWKTANPWVVNEVQIDRSDAVLVGHWLDRRAGTFEVTEDLLNQVAPGTVTITGLPPAGGPAEKTWVIPVIKRGALFVVTAGDFSYYPIDPVHGEYPQPQKGTIAPQCYPATPDVLEQIRRVQETRPAPRT